MKLNKKTSFPNQNSSLLLCLMALFLFLFFRGEFCFGVIMVEISEVRKLVTFTTKENTHISTAKCFHVFTFDTDAHS